MSEGVQDGDHHLTDSDVNAVQGKLDKRACPDPVNCPDIFIGEIVDLHARFRACPDSVNCPDIFIGEVTGWFNNDFSGVSRQIILRGFIECLVTVAYIKRVASLRNLIYSLLL
uniref:TRAF-type domain-containing protein n=1 Tax=Ascaris lumbricoides TaxID=6252 RepID=A0A0M3IG37_ASCLU